MASCCRRVARACGARSAALVVSALVFWFVSVPAAVAAARVRHHGHNSPIVGSHPRKRRASTCPSYPTSSCSFFGSNCRSCYCNHARGGGGYCSGGCCGDLCSDQCSAAPTPPPPPSKKDTGSCSSNSQCTTGACKGGQCCNSKGVPSACTSCYGDGDCKACSSGYTLSRYSCQLCSSTNRATCASGKYRTGSCSSSSNGYKCNTCDNINCASGTYRSGSCSGTSNSFRCSTCKNEKCGSNQFRSGSCSGSNNGYSCTDQPVCSRGSVLVGATATQKGVCSSCGRGKYVSNGICADCSRTPHYLCGNGE